MNLNEYFDAVVDECGDDELNVTKADVAWVLGLEPDSDEWYELMDI